MSQAITVFGGQLPDPKALAQATQRYEAETENMGSVFMKFKEGRYMFGSDGTEPQEGSQWAVNPWSMTHGWILFDNKFDLIDQRNVVPASDVLPERPENPSTDISKSGWQEQYSFSLMCLNGEDKGLEVVLNTSSKGGVNACKSLIAAFSRHVNYDADGAATPLPVIELNSDSYYNKTYRRDVFIPVFTVVDFIGANDLLGEAVEPEEAKPAPSRQRRPAAEEAKPTPSRQRRPAAAQEAKPEVHDAEYEETGEEEEEEEDSTAPPPADETPRRRRRAV